MNLNFIKANNTYPITSSADEIVVNGIELAFLNVKMPQKMEELTLYILQQHKKITVQQINADLLKKKTDQQQVDELKRRIGNQTIRCHIIPVSVPAYVICLSL